MSSTPQARTPAKNPAGHHPARRRLPVHHNLTSATAHAARGVTSHATTPPRNAKKAKPSSVSLTHRQEQQDASATAELDLKTEMTTPASVHRSVSGGGRHSSPSASTQPLPTSGRRHTDTEGVLAFLHAEDLSRTPPTTPLRPSQQPDSPLIGDATDVKREEEGEEEAESLCLSTTLAPSTAFATAAAAAAAGETGVVTGPTTTVAHADEVVSDGKRSRGSYSNSSSSRNLKGAAMRSPSVEVSAEAVADISAETGAAGTWFSVKKPSRARSLSATSLLSPTHAVCATSEGADGANDCHDEMETSDVAAAAGQAVTGAGCTTDVARCKTHNEGRPEKNNSNSAAGDCTVTGVGCVDEAGHTPAPLPVTPERPAQVRYFRCAKPLLKIGSDVPKKNTAAAATTTAPGPSATAASVGPAVVMFGIAQMTEEEASEADSSDASVASCVCGNVFHEDSYTVASPLVVQPTKDDEKLLSSRVLPEREEVGEDKCGDDATLHAPRALDMNTTVLSDEDDDDEADKDAEGAAVKDASVSETEKSDGLRFAPDNSPHESALLNTVTAFAATTGAASATNASEEENYEEGVADAAGRLPFASAASTDFLKRKQPWYRAICPDTETYFKYGLEDAPCEASPLHRAAAFSDVLNDYLGESIALELGDDDKSSSSSSVEMRSRTTTANSHSAASCDASLADSRAESAAERSDDDNSSSSSSSTDIHHISHSTKTLHRIATAVPGSLPPTSFHGALQGNRSAGISDSHDRSGTAHNDSHVSGGSDGHGPSRQDSAVHVSLTSATSRRTPDEELMRAKSTADAAGTDAAGRMVTPSPSRTALSAEGGDSVAKRVSLSSGRGQSSSYGCTEGMTSPASHQTRRSTPRPDNEEGTAEGENDDEAVRYGNLNDETTSTTAATAGRRSTSPMVIAPAGERLCADNAADPADVLLFSKNDSVEAVRKLVVVPLDEVRLSCWKPRKDIFHEGWEETGSMVAEYHAELHHTRNNASGRLWQAQLASLDALVEEHLTSLLAIVMKEFRVLWQPPTPPTGLHSVNKAALMSSPSNALTKVKAKGAKSTPLTTRQPLTAFTGEAQNAAERLEPTAEHARETEFELLFRLFISAPSARTQKRLLRVYFWRQLQRYENWVRHLEFEFLYVRMVAVRAMQMLEMHERRLTCMRRDLGIRDKIELFVLLAPRPRAPTLSTGRGVISAFRMALHAISGGGGGGSSASRSHSSSGSRGSRSNSKKPPKQEGQTLASTTRLPPPPPLRASTSDAGRPPLQLKKKKDGEAETREKMPMESGLEPLFASERCRSGKYAVPVVCEIATRPGESGPGEGRAACFSSTTLNTSTAAATPRAAAGPDATGSGQAEEVGEVEAHVSAKRAETTSPPAPAAEKSAVIPLVREVVKEFDPPRESTDRHRGTPRPLNKTYSDYYKLVEEKKKKAPRHPPPLFTDIRLPQLRRTASRTSSGASRRASTDKSGDDTANEASQRSLEKDTYAETVSKVGRQLSGRKLGTSPKRQKDRVLKDGRLRARERMPAQERTRTPPAPPTEAEFVDLRDEEALRRFVM